jgi:hypothetical protein
MVEQFTTVYIYNADVSTSANNFTNINKILKQNKNKKAPRLAHHEATLSKGVF